VGGDDGMGREIRGVGDEGTGGEEMKKRRR